MLVLQGGADASITRRYLTEGLGLSVVTEDKVYLASRWFPCRFNHRIALAGFPEVNRVQLDCVARAQIIDAAW